MDKYLKSNILSVEEAGKLIRGIATGMVHLAKVRIRCELFASVETFFFKENLSEFFSLKRKKFLPPCFKENLFEFFYPMHKHFF